MAFTASISVNLDAVNETTIVNATGEVLRELGKKIFAAVSRLRQHVVRAQQALNDAHTAPPHIQQSLGVEVTTARQRFDRLVGLLVLVHDKVKDEQAAQQRARRRMPAAIDWLSNDEWDVISVMGSVFDDDIPSLAETGSESSRKGNDFHHYGFVTFKYLDAAKRCVHELERMDVDRHRGMTPIVERDDGYAAHAVLTFSFSKPNKDKLNKARRQLNVGGYGRSSSRSRPALRRHCRPPVYDSDSDETGLE